MDYGRVSCGSLPKAARIVKSWQPWVLGLAACALIGMSVQKVHAQQSYFDWLAEGDNGNNPTPGMNYVTTPTLSDATESEDGGQTCRSRRDQHRRAVGGNRTTRGRTSAHDGGHNSHP